MGIRYESWNADPQDSGVAKLMDFIIHKCHLNFFTANERVIEEVKKLEYTGFITMKGAVIDSEFHFVKGEMVDELVLPYGGREYVARLGQLRDTNRYPFRVSKGGMIFNHLAGTIHYSSGIFKRNFHDHEWELSRKFPLILPSLDSEILEKLERTRNSD